MKKSEFIVQDLLSKIYQRQFPDGKLPTQRELAVMYGVSRYTVQIAVKNLADIGVVRLVQGSGIYVRDQFRINPLVFNSLTRAPYAKIVSKCLSFAKDVATPDEAQIFQMDGFETVWRYLRLRIVDGTIEQIEESSLPTALFPDFSPKVVERSVQAYVEGHGYRISHYLTTYSPKALSRVEAQLMCTKRSTPAILICNRAVLSNGRVFEYSRVTAIDYAVSYIRPYDREIHNARLEGMSKDTDLDA